MMLGTKAMAMPEPRPLSPRPILPITTMLMPAMASTIASILPTLPFRYSCTVLAKLSRPPSVTAVPPEMVPA